MTNADRGRVLALVPSAAARDLEHMSAEAGVDVWCVRTLRELLDALTTGGASAVVLSLSAEHLDERVAHRIRETGANRPLVLTAPAVTLERAILKERLGATALLREPIDTRDLLAALALATDEGAEVPLPDPVEPGLQAVPPLVGESPVMASIFETLARVAVSDATVLVTGESGTGKEVVARALHGAGPRRSGPFVAMNCAAIPEHLLESELFGHEKGAFTGAVARRVGRFERANGGTLFLDEIGDMSLVLQAKVLRALEERVVERVGGEGSVPVDVRVVAATNQDLGRAMEEHRFREDLYYRLAVVQMHLPPLRERGADLRLLALHLAASFAARHARPVRAISEEALCRLEGATWPGNVRELRNVMDRAVLLAQGTTIRTSDLRIGHAAPNGSMHVRDAHPTGYDPALSLEEVEAAHIRRVLGSVEGHRGRAAEVLGIHRNTLTRKMREYGIDGVSDTHEGPCPD